MLRLNCFFQANEGMYDAALEAALVLTAHSVKEEGCIAYDTFESATRPDVFMICETWADEASLEQHMQAPHFKQYVPMMEACGTLKLEKFTF